MEVQWGGDEWSNSEEEGEDEWNNREVLYPASRFVLDIKAIW